MPFPSRIFFPRLSAPQIRVVSRLLRLLVWGWSLGTGVVLSAETDAGREHQVKAAFLYNFTKFVQWPAERFGDATSPIIIGVLGDRPMRTELEKIVQGRKVDGREILVVEVEAPESASVHVLFVGAGAEKEFAGELPSYQDTSVLTVGESPEFAAAGGIITFTRKADKVRFEINIGAAEQSRLKISAQLQKLATVVSR
jgi:hypothetical protein